jgi:hypothetical protein
MPLPIDFMRGLVGLIGIGCAFMLARAVAAFRKGQVRVSRLYGWIIRLTLCMAAVWYPVRGSIDAVDLVVYALAAAAFAAGYWDATRVKEQEDLTSEIFPDSDKEPK